MTLELMVKYYQTYQNYFLKRTFWKIFNMYLMFLKSLKQ